MSRKKRCPPFVMIRKDLLNDPEWRNLSNQTKILYIYLRAKFNYRTLSEVTLAYSEIQDIMSSKTTSKGFKELINAGFIEKIKHGGLYGGVCIYKFKGEYADFFFNGRAI